MNGKPERSSVVACSQQADERGAPTEAGPLSPSLVYTGGSRVNNIYKFIGIHFAHVRSIVRKWRALQQQAGTNDAAVATAVEAEAGHPQLIFSAL